MPNSQVKPNGKGRGMDLIVRVYDDGMAWRYRIKGKGAAKVRSEVSAFNVSGGLAGWLQEYENAYEWRYHKTSGGKPGKRYGFPAMFETKNGWVLLTEASVYDYAGSGLLGGKEPFNFTVAPMGDGRDIACPWVSPWRVAIIGRSPCTIVESTLVQNLNPAREIKDTSRIHGLPRDYVQHETERCREKDNRRSRNGARGCF